LFTNSLVLENPKIYKEVPLWNSNTINKKINPLKVPKSISVRWGHIGILLFQGIF